MSDRSRGMRTAVSAAAAAMIVAVGGACGDGGAGADVVAIDGSSTVYPITRAVAEEFMIETRREVPVTVGVSGTGGGFQRFCAGEIAIADASRAIKPSELEACRAAGIEPVELPVAYDGLAVTVNPANDFVDCLTVEELREIWRPGSTVEMWSDVRPEWPDEEIRLYGPGTSSGTFDYFTEAIMGEEDASRADYTASEDDNVLVQGIVGDENALGYFGYAYYAENRDRVEVVAVDDGTGCVEPTPETIGTGEYAPLSRPLYIYVARDALARPGVRRFVDFYLDNAPELAAEVGYVPLAPETYAEVRRTVEQAVPRATDAGTA